MEDVLEVYHREFEDTEVLVCLDETSRQLVGETRQPLPPRPGYARAYDYEYQRNGVSNRFMLLAPLEGWRRVEVTQRRTKSDWARVVRKLVDEDYADKERIVLVMDNPVSWYGAGSEHPPSRLSVRGLCASRGAAHCRASGDSLHSQAWELVEYGRDRTGVLARQCLDRRIPDQEILAQETGAWQGQRNREAIRVDWRFTTQSLPSATTGGCPR